MPLAFVNGALLYFAHVPRAAGTSIEQYLIQRFGPLAFLDPAFLAVPEAERWSRTSPQHLTAAALSRLVPESWIRHRFAVVRHPEDRILSVFRFQRDIEGNIPPGPAPVVTRTARTLILELFWKNFECFGYEPRSGNADNAPAARWPAMRATETA